MVLSIMSETEKYQIIYFFGNIFIIGFCTDILIIVKAPLIYGESAYFLTRQSVSDRCVPDSLFLDFLYPVYPSPVSYVMYVPWMICPLDEKTPTDVPPSLYYILSSSAAFGRVWDMGYIGQGSSCISCNSQGTSHPGARIGRGQKIQEETIRDTSVRDGLSWHPGRRTHS
jgi:hypothetical protein